MLTELQWPARVMVIFLVGILPVLTVVQARLRSNQSESEWPSRQKFYACTFVSLWMLTIVSLIAAAESGFRAELLGLANITVANFVIWLLFSVTATAALIIAFKAFGQKETPLLGHLIPQTRAEKISFIGVSLT